MRFGPRELIVLALIIAVPVASFFLVFKPQNERIKRSEAEIKHKLEMLEKLRKELERLARVGTSPAGVAIIVCPGTGRPERGADPLHHLLRLPVTLVLRRRLALASTRGGVRGLDRVPGPLFCRFNHVSAAGSRTGMF